MTATEKNTRCEMERVPFTKEMKGDYTILVPDMAPIHFELLGNVLRSYGYRIAILKTQGDSIVRAGLRYVHNDTCYPALLVIGQFIDALDSGEYDLTHTALMITQTGGGCRASNYIHLLRKALEKAGYGYIPVVSVNVSGMEKNSGFRLTLPMIRKMMVGLIYGDALMLLSNQTRPYELEPGMTDEKVQTWIKSLSAELKEEGKGCSLAHVRARMETMVADFDAIPRQVVPKIKVGIVGEIYVKYSPLGNNNLERFLADQGCEVNVPGIMDFCFFMLQNQLEDRGLYGGSLLKHLVIKKLMNYYLKFEKALADAVSQHPRFRAPSQFEHLKNLVNGVIGRGNKMGEGWLLTAEMLELVEQGFENIVCAQPFGCLPNHICGKGMIRKITALDERANIVPIDYDPSATKVNQENRIKLMLALAKEKLEEQQKAAQSPELPQGQAVHGVACS